MRAGIAMRALAVLAALSAALPAEAGATGWPTYHGGAGLDGAAEGRLPERPRLLWRIETGAPVRATPISGGGRIYALTERGDLIAVSPGGRRLWQAKLDDKAAEGGGSPAGFLAPPLYVAGSVVVASLGGTVFAVDAATGRPRWEARPGGRVQGSPTYVPGAAGAPDAVLVLSQEDGRVRRFDLATGRDLGGSPATNRCDGSAAVGEGMVVFGNCDAALHLLSAATLKPLARLGLERDGEVYAGVAVSGGMAYAGDRAGRLYAVDLAARRIRWVNRDAARDISAPPAVRDGLVAFSSDDGFVRGVDAGTGRTRWRRETAGRPGAPLIDARGTVAVSARGVLLILDGGRGTPLWSREVSDEITAPSLAEGLLLVGTDDGAVLAFGETDARGR